MNIIYLYTRQPHSYFSLEALKRYARFFLRKSRGPQAVDASIIRGLNELVFDYQLNDPWPKFDGRSVIFVNNSLDALRWAIGLKRKGKIGRLIAGPNLVIDPHDADNLILSPEIDRVIVPSLWVQEAYLLSAPELKDKIFSWPAGIADDGLGAYQGTKKPLLYIKNVPLDVRKWVEESLAGSCYETIVYGNFSRREYLDRLERTSFLVYLQESESQGISLLEAWMKDVPTLVWNRGSLMTKAGLLERPDIAAPYLNSDSGAFFSSSEELRLLIKTIQEKEKYHPRAYYLSRFTDKQSAQELLSIINFSS